MEVERAERFGPHLVVTDVVIAFVYALPVRPVPQRLRDVLNIWNPVDEWCNWPASVSLGNLVQIN